MVMRDPFSKDWSEVSLVERWPVQALPPQGSE
jgi:hypothetical protein